jgi:hypothetical protein
VLGEHGERTGARFADPHAMQRRSALALASSLDNEADVAAAADMMILQLGPPEITHLIEVMVDASRGAAYHLAVELCARLDLDIDTRERIAEVALNGSAPLPVVRGTQRPVQVAVLVDANHKVVVVASRKVSIRRWRRWAVLIGAHGAIDDCVHDERPASSAASDGDNAPLIARLVADGYQVASTELERARGIVAAAARQSTLEGDNKLPSAYYLGRDLLDLGEAHLGGRVHAHPTSTSLGRAVELIADGDHARAQLLLARCAESADVAAATPSLTCSPLPSSSLTSPSITGTSHPCCITSATPAALPPATPRSTAFSRRASSQPASSPIQISQPAWRSQFASPRSSSALRASQASSSTASAAHLVASAARRSVPPQNAESDLGPLPLAFGESNWIRASNRTGVSFRVRLADTLL